MTSHEPHGERNSFVFHHFFYAYQLTTSWWTFSQFRRSPRRSHPTRVIRLIIIYWACCQKRASELKFVYSVFKQIGCSNYSKSLRCEEILLLILKYEILIISGSYALRSHILFEILPKTVQYFKYLMYFQYISYLKYLFVFQTIWNFNFRCFLLWNTAK